MVFYSIMCSMLTIAALALALGLTFGTLSISKTYAHLIFKFNFCILFIYFKETSNVTYGGKCVLNTDCVPNEYLVCFKGKCYCESNTFYSGETCGKSHIKNNKN